VLASGGAFGLMLYHRRSLFYAWRIAFHEGLVHAERDFLDPVALSSRYTDAAEAEGNPHTWPVTKSEVRAAMGALASRMSFRVMGMELAGALDFMLPGLGRLPAWMIKPWARRFGWSLWAEGARA
jgi:hypothetical protein